MKDEKAIIKWLIVFTLIVTGNFSLAQGISGMVTDQDQNPLPFATIYIKQAETGTSTNQDGYYEIKLSSGTYDLVFQYMGYQTIEKKVEIQNEFKNLDILLPTQALMLKEVKVRSGLEDPAYTIMRKAIAKSKFHTLQVNRYTAQVYTKGAGRVKDMPFLLEGFLKKKGVDSSTVYLLESVSEVTYESPNTIKEKVISVRSIGNDNGITPNNYINRSIYEPQIAGIVSPLSPRAFSYYGFSYEGSFFDRGREINKIRVIPRTKGDNIFQGYIFIIEDLWSIHSLDLITFRQGFEVNIKQIYAPIQETVWMPVNHRIEVSGKIYGFELEYKYLATVSNYTITLNPELDKAITVVDENVTDLQDITTENEAFPTDSVTPAFPANKPLTRKELKKMVKAYEKEMLKQEKNPEVVRNTSLTVDSAAYQHDSAYWASIRPVPLNTMEINSYQKLDSMIYAEQDKNNSDGESTGGSGWLFGHSFQLGDSGSLSVQSPLFGINFNTVEGYNFELPIHYQVKLTKGKKFEISPVGRYAFASNKLSGKVSINFNYHQNAENGSIRLEGGRYVSQFNKNNPIDPLVNSLSTLLWERNFMKIYEKDYIKISLNQAIDPKLWVNSSLEWGRRNEMFNITDRTWNDRKNRQYTPNAPKNIENRFTGFPQHDALIFDTQISFYPFLKYFIRNGTKRPLFNSSPGFLLSYRRGFENSLGSDVSFDQFEAEVKGIFKPGIRGSLQYDLYAGQFLNDDKLYFMDYRHFMGNRTLLQVSDPAGSFRLLDYYQYSTAKSYIGSHLYYQFRKFLLTQIMEIRFLGLNENVFVNYLKTSSSPHYTEFGYSLDNIFRFLRLELVSGFEDMRFTDFGFRIGIATRLGNRIRNQQ